MDDDELIARDGDRRRYRAAGVVRTARAGRWPRTSSPASCGCCSPRAFVGAGRRSGSAAVQAALLWAALHWHWNTAGLVIAAGAALITVLGRRESGREFRPGKLSGDDLQGA